MEIIKPEKFSLYWMEDNTYTDWFMLTPTVEGNSNIEKVLACEMHSHYESLNIELSNTKIHPECHATFVCHVPAEILTNTKVNQKYFNDQPHFNFNYFDISKSSYDDLMFRLEDNEMVFDEEFLHELSDKLISAIMDSDGTSNLERAYNFVSKNFSSNKTLATFMAIFYEQDDEFEYIESLMNFLYLWKVKKQLKENSYPYGYGAIHAHNEILVKIDGMTQISEGGNSKNRIYIYNGKFYEEGVSMDNKITKNTKS